ncbi:MAG: stage V sporulation protein AD [Firmicutes bacterium]|nr:stage V sporulation protein AD [Bacillota bacterium]
MQVAERRVGGFTLAFRTPVAIEAAASVAGPVEGRGPLASYFDRVVEDKLFGHPTWESAEAAFLRQAVDLALQKRGLKGEDLDYLVAGDLINQLGASSFAARAVDRPFLGLFGACATWAEALTVGALLIDGGYARRVGVAVSSHHEAAERQFRYPVEFGYQRPATATWTATGAAAALLAAGGEGPRLTMATVGRVIDMGVKDPFDLGAAMAAAAADTIVHHLRDAGRSPQDYDLIATGDLGSYGLPITADLVREAGYDLGETAADCGVLLYERAQGVGAGGSGTACSGLVTAGYLYREMLAGNLRSLLLVSTGALFSPTSYHQGESIPCVAHAVSIEWGAGAA